MDASLPFFLFTGAVIEALVKFPEENLIYNGN